MILTRLVIRDFGVYRGQHEFDLRPRTSGTDSCPVVLIGGKNGSGKTTLLEAIRLCLYGRSALGQRVRKTDYETYIRQRFHRKADIFSSSVGIVFEHVYAGHRSVYDVIRSWKLEGQSLHETVSIYKDGMALRDIAPEYWSDFLRDLIPPGVADLFFFDGEQIQSLADDATEATSLESALGGLLNVDIVERLQSDLDSYLKRQDGSENGSLTGNFESIITELEQVEREFQERFQDQGAIQSEILRIQEKMRRSRKVLVSEAAHFVENRASIEARLEQIETKIQSTRNQIKELAAGLLPFAYAPAWSQRLSSRLQNEQETVRNEILINYHHSIVSDLLEKLDSNFVRKLIASRVTDEEWKNVIGEIGNYLKPSQKEPVDTIIHQVSEQQRARLLQQITEVLQDIPKQMQLLGMLLENLETERSDLNFLLKQVPEDDVALPLIEEFQELSEQMGRLVERKVHLDETIRHLNFQRSELERKRSKAWAEIAKSGDIDSRIDYAAKVQGVLDEYLKEITKLKLEELEQLVSQYFNLLCCKEMIIKEVKIDPNNYSVKLYGDNREELPKSDLSAGEKQLYAMALLWALRSISGRQLPIIIDAPMGRLDSNHRLRLLNEFFPNAAHQIILLSTDTEVDESAFEVLQPFVSHTYLLNYDSDLGETLVETEYFASVSGEALL